MNTRLHSWVTEVAGLHQHHLAEFKRTRDSARDLGNDPASDSTVIAELQVLARAHHVHLHVYRSLHAELLSDIHRLDAAGPIAVLAIDTAESGL